MRTLGFREDTFMLGLAIVIGLGTGAAATGFYKLVEGAIWLYYEELSGSLHIFDNWWLLPMLVLLPVSGGLLVGAITYFFAREAKGHGVPEVMDAIARKNGIIRPRVALAKAIASALTIGSGGSAGTEGPIVQIGAALGSSAGQFFRLSKRQLPVLIGCGAAAGIASIFNAPIAGVLFALEIFLFDFSFRTFTPVVLSSVMSATITHALLGDKFMLALPDFQYQFHWWEVGNYLVLGLLAGVLAAGYIRAIYATEDLFDIRLKRVHFMLRPALGALVLGLLGIAVVLFYRLADHAPPVVFGNGYAFIRIMLDPAQYSAGGLTVMVLAVLMVGKLLATCLTLGSGGSGGVFAPSLFMGAALGGLFGLVLQQVFPGMGINPVAYAVVGMAAVFAGSTHAFLTAIVMLFEMTGNYKVVLPIMLAATIATAVSQVIKRSSIYTEKLQRRGIRMGMVADMTLLRGLAVEQLKLAHATFAHENEPLSMLLEKAAGAPTADFVVLDDHEHYRGMVVAEDLRVALLEREAVPLLLVRELARSQIPTVSPGDSLADVFDTFSRHDVSALPVAAPDDPETVTGLITRAALMRRYHEELSAGKGYGRPRNHKGEVGKPPLMD